MGISIEFYFFEYHGWIREGKSFKFKFSKELCHLAKLLDVGSILWICGFVLVFYGGICD
jgi:hypothetical protein